MDRRIARTRSALLETLTELMLESPWDAINVQQICDHADVSRSTFYAHFDNKQELLEFAFQMLEARMKDTHPTRGLNRDGTFGFLPELLNHVKSHCDLFRTNSSTLGGFAIFNRFKRVVDNLAEHELKISGRPHHVSIDEVSFVTGGVFALLEQWNREGCVESVESLNVRIDALVSKVLRAS